MTIRKGGNIIADPGETRWTSATIAEPLTPVVAGNPGFGHDVLEVRRGLEGQAAYHAALRATPDDIAAIRACFDRLADDHASGDAVAEAHADAAFHLAIADASHNAVLRSVMASMFDLLQSSISQSLDKLYIVPRTFERLSEQHQALVEAIASGDADAARLASDTHLDFVAHTIRTIDEERARIERARNVPPHHKPEDLTRHDHIVAHRLSRSRPRRLPPFLFHYIDGGANAEYTLGRNVSDLSEIELRQRVLKNVESLDISTELFGRKMAMPVALSPVGLTGMYARRGEVQGPPAPPPRATFLHALSTVSVCPIEEVQKASPAPIWFQLYVLKDRGFMKNALSAPWLRESPPWSSPSICRRLARAIATPIPACPGPTPPSAVWCRRCSIRTGPSMSALSPPARSRQHFRLSRPADQARRLYRLARQQFRSVDLLERSGVDPRLLEGSDDHQGHSGCRRPATPCASARTVSCLQPWRPSAGRRALNRPRPA